MIARAHPRRPKYEWIQTLALARFPQNVEQIRPDFWDRMDAAVKQMKPSQRKIFTLYRNGVTVPAIATLLECKRHSIYNRLAEIDQILKASLSGDNSSSKRGTPKIKTPSVLLTMKGH